MTTLFPVGGTAIVRRMCALFPELHVNVDEPQRELTYRINQQLAYTYGPKHGGKVRTGLDPVKFLSKDSAAVLESDGSVSTWDLFQGNPEATILVEDGKAPDHPNLGSDATFVPVTPFNWLGDDAGEPDGDEPEPPPEDLQERIRDLEEVVGAQSFAIEELQHQNGRQQSQLEELLARLAKLETRKLKARGRTTAAGRSILSHWHDADLDVYEAEG